MALVVCECQEGFSCTCAEADSWGLHPRHHCSSKPSLSPGCLQAQPLGAATGLGELKTTSTLPLLLSAALPAPPPSCSMSTTGSCPVQLPLGWKLCLHCSYGEGSREKQQWHWHMGQRAAPVLGSLQLYLHCSWEVWGKRESRKHQHRSNLQFSSHGSVPHQLEAKPTQLVGWEGETL